MTLAHNTVNQISAYCFNVEESFSKFLDRDSEAVLSFFPKMHRRQSLHRDPTSSFHVRTRQRQ